MRSRCFRDCRSRCSTRRCTTPARKTRDRHDLRTVSAEAQLGKPHTQLRALGTAGLTAVDKNPGSYAYLAVVDPATRAGIVGGWLTHDRGSGVVFSPVENDAVRMDAQIDYGRLRIKPGQDARRRPSRSAGSTMRGWDWKPTPTRSRASTRSSCRRSRPVTAPGTRTSTAAPATKSTWRNWRPSPRSNLKPFGFDFVQIDDGWQDGVSTNGPAATSPRIAPPVPTRAA